MGARNYRDLIAWQKAMDLVEVIYLRTTAFPGHEIYGLTQQVRRAAVSIPSNIAEGEGRQSHREFARFLAIAHGSVREVETQILIARRLNYIDPQIETDLMDRCGEIGRLIAGLVRSLRHNQEPH